jgi:D-glycero-alpha-D-manno-heptose 1-phosphate guanylyltransferase
MSQIKGDSAFVVNGDTLFRADLAALEHTFLTNDSLLTIALAEMRNFDRYGTVEFNADTAQLIGFLEKQPMDYGFINGGVYLLRKELFEMKPLEERFSFEQEILEDEIGRDHFHAVPFERYFIDIGIPEDYARAQEELEDLPEEIGVPYDLARNTSDGKDSSATPAWMQTVDKSWTLFLDRDGVINRRLVGDYVKSWEEFEFLPGALEGLAQLAEQFERIVVVTNQRGIGRGLMTELDLAVVHDSMMTAIQEAGGRIDAIYHCPDIDRTPGGCRKPDPGMALAAQAEFPEIDFRRSIMVGDAPSDIVFGQRLGMQVVWAGEVQGDPPEGALVVESLAELAERI